MFNLWVSIKDSLPLGDKFIGSDGEDIYLLEDWEIEGDHYWINYDGKQIENIRYWMPLPELPDTN